MKRLILVLSLCAAWLGMSAQERDSLSVMFWNVENLFDYKDTGKNDSDRDFSSRGSRKWTKTRFQRKCDAIAKSILWVGDRYGKVPDVIGFAEVENRNVLYRLLEDTLLRKYGYRIIHRESSDRRGIDVALIYRESVFEKVSVSFHTPYLDGVPIKTRDILHVRLRNRSDKQSMDFIVNHHPSKYGGKKESEKGRMAAMRSLVGICDSLDCGNVVVMGDFNDVPTASQFDVLRDAGFICNADSLHITGKGTIRYKGNWEMIDMFWVSPDLSSKTFMELCEIPFLMEWDNVYPGYKPLRTYTGPAYRGGVSDHLPILLRIL